MPELWLRKTFPVVSFANSNLPEKRYNICKSKDELSQLPEDSTDVFKIYVLETEPKDFNDSQPEVLVDDDIESPLSYPKLIPLMRSKDKMRCRSAVSYTHLTLPTIYSV